MSLHRCQVRAAHCRAAPHESRTTVKHRSATTAGLDRDGSSSTLLLAVTTPPSSAEAPADDQEAAVGVWRASCRSLVTLVMILSFFPSFFLSFSVALLPFGGPSFLFNQSSLSLIATRVCVRITCWARWTPNVDTRKLFQVKRHGRECTSD